MSRPRLIAVLPTMLTLGNAACGFGAITFAAKLGPTEIVATNGADGVEFQASMIAASLIYLAMLFDALDGSVARMMKQTSELGAQLDSLCDAISFGVAPAFLMLQFVTKELDQYGGFAYWPRALWTIAVLFLLCAIMRLARFNVESEEEDTHDVFSGLPSPAAAGTIAAFPFAMPTLVEYTSTDMSIPVQTVATWLIPSVRAALPIITFLVACLMVSRIRYPHYFAQLLSEQRSRRHIIQLVFAVAVIFWVHELLPVLFCYFAFAAPIRAAWTTGLARTLYKSRS